MKQETGAHLSKDAMLHWQLGDASGQERAHVAFCAACQAEIKSTTDALGWFGSAAREWGEQKARVTEEWKTAKSAAALEWREIPSAAASEWRGSKAYAVRNWRPMVASWALACMLLLLVFGIGLPRWRAHRSAILARAQQQQMQQELARDNALMEQVDQDVSQIVPQAMQPLSWDTYRSSGSHAAVHARQ